MLNELIQAIGAVAAGCMFGIALVCNHYGIPLFYGKVKVIKESHPDWDKIDAEAK